MPSFMRKINIIGRCAEMYRTDKFEGTGLRGCLHSYILALCCHPGLSQEQLSKRIYINKSNVTRNLAQLEKEGFVERRQSEEDKRVTLVYPTEKAHAVFGKVVEVVEEWKSYLTEDFSAEELALFNSMLDRITKRAIEAVKKEFDDQ